MIFAQKNSKVVSSEQQQISLLPTDNSLKHSNI